jgi:lipoyl(octanoyl) transferase
LGVGGERSNDRIGVWVRRRGPEQHAEDKIAAIGVRVRHWVTLHGVALNVAPNLSHFSGIVPCGIADRHHGLTSLAALGVTASMAEVDEILRREFEPLFGATVDLQPLDRTENNSPGRRNSRSRSPASV